MPVSHPGVGGSSRACMGPCTPPSSQDTAHFHLGLTSWGKGEGDDLEDMAQCLALHVLQLPCWRFPVFRIKMSIRNKLLNQQENGNGKSSRSLRELGAIANTARSCWLWLWGMGTGLAAATLPPWPRRRVVLLFSTKRPALLGLPSPTRH